MKIVILSREKIEELAQKSFPPKTAVISITDAEWTYAELKNKPDYLLQLEFEDVDNDVFYDELGRLPESAEEREKIARKYYMMFPQDAQNIAKFYLENADDIEVLICQCEHGQSRSAAVAAAIAEYRTGSGIKIFAHDKYYPNKMVFQMVLAELKRLGGKR